MSAIGRCRQTGITLIELIFSLALFAVLAAIGLPALGKFIDSARARNASGQLAASLGLARTNAISRHRNVVVCPSRDQEQCDDSLWWQQGWIVFIDTDRNGKRSTDEPLLEVVPAQRATAIMTSVGRKFVSYRDDGSATGTNLTYTICDLRGTKDATTLVVNNAGRVRIGAPSPAQATAACAGL